MNVRNRNTIFRVTGVLCLLLVLLFISCQPLPIEPGIPIIRRPTWWNFYQRGIAYSLVNEWEMAANDFLTALGTEIGAIYPEFNEKRRAKTYGLHFLKDYFPHRELGISYYNTGKYEQAENELRLSVDMLPSSRAKLYLNKTRKAQFSGIDKRTLDSIQFQMDMASGILYINRPFVLLKGRIASPYRISQLSVNGTLIFIELAEEEYDLQQKVYLPLGKQKISIKVLDLAGNKAAWSREAVVDVTGPAISFSPVADDPENSVRIVIIDNFALHSVIIEGKAIEIPKQQKVYEHRLLLKPHRKIKIQSLDKAKNRTILESNTGDLLKASIQTRKHYPDTRLVSAWVEPENLPTRLSGTGVIQETKSDRLKPVNAIADFQIVSTPPIPPKLVDTMSPRLKIYPAVKEQIMVTTELYVLDAEVIDSGYIDSVTFALNNKREARRLREFQIIKHRFTQTLELEPGENHLKIIARDRAGNEKTKEFIIKRKIEVQWREDLRITAQVLPPGKAGYRSLETIDLYSMFLQALLRTPRRLNIVERNPEIMKRLLMELKLEESKLGDQLRAVKIGKLTPSDWLLQGYVTQWSGKENWDLVINVVDVATSEYVLTTDIHFTGINIDDIRFQLIGLVGKLNQQLPTLSSQVAATLTKGVKIPLGKRNNIKYHMRFIFISGDEDEFEFSDPKMFGNHWIQGTVKVLNKQNCLVEIFPKEAIDHIKVNDLAIVR